MYFVRFLGLILGLLSVFFVVFICLSCIFNSILSVVYLVYYYSYHRRRLYSSVSLGDLTILDASDVLGRYFYKIDSFRLYRREIRTIIILGCELQ